MILTSLLSIANAHSQQSVGFQSYHLEDSLQINVWYPSTKGIVGSYQNYLLNTSVKHLSTQVVPNTDIYLSAYLSGFIFGKEIELSKIVSIQALNNSNPATTVKYPLVIYAPGYRGLPFENSLLCEQLAQTGYVVASIPSLGVNYKTDSVGCEIQVNYIKEAIKFAKQNLHFVDQDNIHLIGFSWGGLSSIIAAMRNPSIKSVISLDGSIRFFYSVAEKMPGFNPTEFNRPILLFAAEGNDEVDFKFFDKVGKAPAYLIKMKGFNHLDFMSYRFLETPYKNKEKSPSYHQIIWTIKEFLNEVNRGHSNNGKKWATKLQPNVVFSKP